VQRGKEIVNVAIKGGDTQGVSAVLKKKSVDEWAMLEVFVSSCQRYCESGP
jgi:hypothetical protein